MTYHVRLPMESLCIVFVAVSCLLHRMRSRCEANLELEYRLSNIPGFNLASLPPIETEYPGSSSTSLLIDVWIAFAICSNG